MLPMPLKLLMVEDSSMDAELTLLSLERSGLQVRSRLVFDHQAAEHALLDTRYDLILCDCVLPGSSGTDVLAIAQRLAPDTPFIFLSGIYGEEHAVEMIRLGATDYVLKKNLPLSLLHLGQGAAHALPSTPRAWAPGTCARTKTC